MVRSAVKASIYVQNNSVNYPAPVFTGKSLSKEEVRKKLRTRFLNVKEGKVLNVTGIKDDGTGILTVNKPSPKSSFKLLTWNGINIVSKTPESMHYFVHAFEFDDEEKIHTAIDVLFS